MTQDDCVQLYHVLQMYLHGYHRGQKPFSIRKPRVESAASITVQHSLRNGYAWMSGGSRRVRGCEAVRPLSLTARTDAGDQDVGHAKFACTASFERGVGPLVRKSLRRVAI